MCGLLGHIAHLLSIGAHGLKNIFTSDETKTNTGIKAVLLKMA